MRRQQFLILCQQKQGDGNAYQPHNQAQPQSAPVLLCHSEKYRLGNRSALEWVIDQYQVSTDKRSGITSDPNRADDPHYIIDLVGRVVAVSVETVRIIAALP